MGAETYVVVQSVPAASSGSATTSKRAALDIEACVAEMPAVRGLQSKRDRIVGHRCGVR